MKFENEMYWAMIETRSPSQSTDRSWKCLCCRDTGIVDDVLMLRLTNALEPEVARETSAPAKRCNRPGCYAADGFAVNGLEAIDSGICQWLHSSAAAEMQGEAPAPSAVIAKVKQLRVGSMPRDRDFASDPILASDPDSVVFKKAPSALAVVEGDCDDF